MGTLRTWWDRMRGRSPPTPARPATRPAVRPEPKAGTDLELTDAPAKRGPQRVGAAGFDPYGNDAGFSKPRGWERVDHD